MLVETRGWYHESSFITVNLIFWDKISHWLWSSKGKPGWLTDQPAPESLLALPRQQCEQCEHYRLPQSALPKILGSSSSHSAWAANSLWSHLPALTQNTLTNEAGHGGIVDICDCPFPRSFWNWRPWIKDRPLNSQLLELGVCRQLQVFIWSDIVFYSRKAWNKQNIKITPEVCIVCSS